MLVKFNSLGLLVFTTPFGIYTQPTVRGEQNARIKKIVFVFYSIVFNSVSQNITELNGLGLYIIYHIMIYLSSSYLN